MMHIIRTPISLASCSRAYSTGGAVELVNKQTNKGNPKFAKEKKLTNKKEQGLWKLVTPLNEFALAYPDFLQSPVQNRRVPLYEELIRADMMERRMVLNIPEFYVGSILAVTLADKNLDTKKRKFLGICIRREKQGLHHTFTLRNFIGKLGVEIMYDLYSPDIQKIDVIRLERRLDNDLSYLIDALPEFSTFDQHMEPIQPISGVPVPLNPLKVALKPPPWSRRWEMYDCRGIDENSIWNQAYPAWKMKFMKTTKDTSYEHYDLIKHYREDAQEQEHELKVMAEMLKFEEEKEKVGKRAKGVILKAMSKKHGFSYNETSVSL